MNRSFLDFVTLVIDRDDKCIAGKGWGRGCEQDNICKKTLLIDFNIKEIYNKRNNCKLVKEIKKYRVNGRFAYE